MPMASLLLLISLTCCLTVPVATKTVSKPTESAESKRRAFPFRLDCFWQEISTSPVKIQKNRAFSIRAKIGTFGRWQLAVGGWPAFFDASQLNSYTKTIFNLL